MEARLSLFYDDFLNKVWCLRSNIIMLNLDVSHLKLMLI